MTDGKDSGTRGRPLHRPGGRRVHEHRRTRTSVSPRAARAGRADGVGVASVPTVWGDRDLQVGQLPAPAVVFERAAAGAGAAAPVSWVWADVLGGVGAAGVMGVGGRTRRGRRCWCVAGGTRARCGGARSTTGSTWGPRRAG